MFSAENYELLEGDISCEMNDCLQSNVALSLKFLPFLSSDVRIFWGLLKYHKCLGITAYNAKLSPS